MGGGQLQPHPPTNGEPLSSSQLRQNLSRCRATNHQLPTEGKKVEVSSRELVSVDDGEDEVQERGEDDEGVCSCEDVCRPPSANIASSTSYYSTAMPCTAAPGQEWPVPDSPLR